MNKWLFVIFLGLTSLFTSCDNEEGFTHVGDLSYKLEALGNLPGAINECSGFTYFDNHLYTINDGKGGDVLYRHNSTSIEMVETIELNGVTNKDWEAITHTATEIVIADIGNNKGNNTSQKIYHLDKFDYSLNNEVTFTFPGQTTGVKLHNFDAESLIIRDDKYCIFTKNRGNKNTDLYTSPVLENNFVFHDSIPVPVRVTDAYYDVDKDVVLLLCNEDINDQFFSFISVIELSDNLSMTLLENIPLPVDDKLEAITKKEGNTYYLGSEIESAGLGLLYEFELKGL